MVELGEGLNQLVERSGDPTQATNVAVAIVEAASNLAAPFGEGMDMHMDMHTGMHNNVQQPDVLVQKPKKARKQPLDSEAAGILGPNVPDKADNTQHQQKQKKRKKPLVHPPDPATAETDQHGANPSNGDEALPPKKKSKAKKVREDGEGVHEGEKFAQQQSKAGKTKAEASGDDEESKAHEDDQPKPKKKRVRKKKPVIVDPDIPYPIPSNDFTVQPTVFGDVLVVWYFANVFSKIIRVTRFSLDLFEQSLANKERSPLLDTLFGSLLAYIGSDTDFLSELLESNSEEKREEIKSIWSLKRGGAKRIEDFQELELLLAVLENDVASIKKDPESVTMMSDVITGLKLIQARVARKAERAALTEQARKEAAANKGRTKDERQERANRRNARFGEEEEEEEEEDVSCYYATLEPSQRARILRRLVDCCSAIASLREYVDTTYAEAIEADKQQRSERENTRKLLKEQIATASIELEEYRVEHGIDAKSLEEKRRKEEEAKRKEEEAKWQHLKKSSKGKRQATGKSKQAVTGPAPSRQQILALAKAQRAEEEEKKQVIKGEETRVQKLEALRTKLAQLSRTEAEASDAALSQFRETWLGFDREQRYYYAFADEGRIFVEDRSIPDYVTSLTHKESVKRKKTPKLSSMESVSERTHAPEEIKQSYIKEEPLAQPMDVTTPGFALAEKSKTDAGPDALVDCFAISGMVDTSKELKEASEEPFILRLPERSRKDDHCQNYQTKWSYFSSVHEVEILSQWFSEDRPCEKDLKENLVGLRDILACNMSKRNLALGKPENNDGDTKSSLVATRRSNRNDFVPFDPQSSVMAYKNRFT